MSVSSFSANKLTGLISKLSEATMGVDTLRYDVVPIVREIISQTEDKSKKVLSYVLWTKCLSICNYYDGEPMSIEASERIVKYLKREILQALKLLASDISNVEESIKLANAIIAIDVKINA